MINQGTVFYKKGKQPNTLTAHWFHSEGGSGTGIAEGKIKTGFEGRFVIKYFDDNGNLTAVRDLIITKAINHYQLKWLLNEKVTAEGVGIEVEEGLTAAWRNI